MRFLSLSDKHHIQLQRFRRNTWKAIALCAAIRIVDATLGLGLVHDPQTLSADAPQICIAEASVARPRPPWARSRMHFLAGKSSFEANSPRLFT